jgi:hypothetical protein
MPLTGYIIQIGQKKKIKGFSGNAIMGITMGTIMN